MPITDLKFSELNTALGGNVFALDGDDITISVKALTGDTYTALTNAGVVEALYKLFKGASTAQLTVNEGQAGADQLRSFSPPTLGNFDAAQNRVPVTVSLRAAFAVDPNSVIGVN